MFDFSSYSAKSKYYDDSNKLVIGKMRHEIGDVAVEELVGLKLNMYPCLVDDNSKQKKANCVNKNVIATIIHNEYEDVLLNKKCSWYSMNRIQSKDHRIRSYEIKKKILTKYISKTMNMMV